MCRCISLLAWLACDRTVQLRCSRRSLIALLGIYSDPVRDSRGHTVTAVYVAEAAGTPVAADDAKNCQLFRLNELPESLAFDHTQVLADYKKYRETGQVAQLRENLVRVSDKSDRFVIH